AKWWIRSSMQDFILRNWSIVRTGSTASQKLLFFNLRRLRAQITNNTNEMMTSEERIKVAKELNVPLRDVESMENRLFNHDLSLSSPLSDESEEDWQDILIDQRSTPEVRIIA